MNLILLYINEREKNNPSYVYLRKNQDS